MSDYRFETKQLHVGQEQADPASGARAVPISHDPQNKPCWRYALWIPGGKPVLRFCLDLPPGVNEE